MFERLFGNPHYKIVAFLVAVLAWLYVQSDEVANGQVLAKLDWQLADGLVSVQTLPRNLVLQVRGTRSAIRRARLKEVSVSVDLSDLGPGEHDLELGPMPVVGLPDPLEVLSRVPSGIRFRLDKEVSRKVEVSARVVGQPAPGYAVRRVTLKPAVVSLTGPASVVVSLDEILTDPIDVDGLMANVEVDAKITLPATLRGSRTDVRAKLHIVALNEQRVFTDVPVQVRGGPGNVTPSTATVELQGPSTLVRELDPKDLVVLLDLPPGSGSYTAAFTSGAPGGVVRVLHGAGREVRTSQLTPSTFEVTR